MIVQLFLLPRTLRCAKEKLKEHLLIFFFFLVLAIDNRIILMLLQEVVISVLMKLAGGSPSVADQLNVDAFLEQARSYDRASSSPVGWYIRSGTT